MSLNTSCPGDRAAVALMKLSGDSGAARELEDVYGPGIIYFAFPTAAAAEKWVAAPQIDERVTYHAEQSTAIFGDAALGAVMAKRANDVIVVVDVVAASTRTTVSLRGGAQPSTIHLELVPFEVQIEALPEPIDSVKASLVDEAVRCEHRGHTQRCLYFIDWRTPSSDDEAVEPERIDEAAFREQLDAADAIGDVPRSLRTLHDLFDTHDPLTHTVVWLRADAADSAWLVATN